MIEIKHDTWPLPNMKQVAEKDFWHYIGIWGCPKSTYIQNQSEPQQPSNEDWQKMTFKERMTWGEIRSSFGLNVFVIDANQLKGGGFVVKHFFSGPKSGIVEYYEWRECEHEFEHTSGGNCYHIHICKKCGARYDIDSSD